MFNVIIPAISYCKNLSCSAPQLRRQSKACGAGLHEGDILLGINGFECRTMSHSSAMALLENSVDSINLSVFRLVTASRARVSNCNFIKCLVISSLLWYIADELSLKSTPVLCPRNKDVQFQPNSDTITTTLSKEQLAYLLKQATVQFNHNATSYSQRLINKIF